MTRTMRHAWAAARRTLRQQWRARLVAFATVAAVILAMVTAADASSAARAASGVALAVYVAIAVTTVGVPGDDLSSGALANDALAGTPPTALVLGAALGSLLAALPACAAVLLSAASPLRGATESQLAAYGVAISCGAASLAAISVGLGTMLAGRNASLFAVLIAFLGFMPPSAIRLENQSEAVNQFLQRTWDSLPMPHHVASAITAAQQGLSISPHVLPLVLGAVVATVAGIATLHVRIATGRWT